MKRSDQDKLLRELLADASVEQVREASLMRGLDVLRRRRRRRAIVTSGAASLAVLVAVAVAWHRRFDPIAPPPSAAQPLTPVAAPVSPVAIITDAQLLALFPDRPVALVGEPGKQKLLFLDAPKNGVQSP